MQNITTKTYIKRKTITGSKSLALGILNVTKQPPHPNKAERPGKALSDSFQSQTRPEMVNL